MAITVRERLGSGQLSKTDDGETGSAELLYDIDGTNDEQQALTALDGQAPAAPRTSRPAPGRVSMKPRKTPVFLPVSFSTNTSTSLAPPRTSALTTTVSMPVR